MSEQDKKFEVEKRFQPTEDQLKKILKGAEYLGEEINHDIYYDYPDYRFLKNEDKKFRTRNGIFELKIILSSGVSQEINDEESIKKYFETNLSLKDFTEKSLKSFMEYKVFRKKYQKDGFIIDLDRTDFGYEVCEIEKLVSDKDKVYRIQAEINKFAVHNGLSLKEVESKRKVYLKKIKPEIYKKIYEVNKKKENRFWKINFK